MRLAPFTIIAALIVLFAPAPAFGQEVSDPPITSGAIGLDRAAFEALYGAGAESRVSRRMTDYPDRVTVVYEADRVLAFERTWALLDAPLLADARAASLSYLPTDAIPLGTERISSLWEVDRYQSAWLAGQTGTDGSFMVRFQANDRRGRFDRVDTILIRLGTNTQGTVLSR